MECIDNRVHFSHVISVPLTFGSGKLPPGILLRRRPVNYIPDPFLRIGEPQVTHYLISDILRTYKSVGTSYFTERFILQCLVVFCKRFHVTCKHQVVVKQHDSLKYPFGWPGRVVNEVLVRPSGN